jgi:hypothetical protein
MLNAAHYYRKDLWADADDYVEIWVEKDGVIGRMSKDDANHLQAPDPGRAVISRREVVAAEVIATDRGSLCISRPKDGFKKSSSMSGEVGWL